MKKVKFAIIGAGSISFCPGTVKDILLSLKFKEVDTEICLMDISEDALSLSHRYCIELVKRLGRNVKIVATTDLSRAVYGANFVITAIEKERYHYWSQDFHIPRRYGFRQIYGENGGPGGMFHALRNMEPMLNIAHAMEKGCPSAWMLNYTNPEAKLVEAIYRRTKVNAVGLCHGDAIGVNHLAAMLRLPPLRIGYKSVGLNHFGWFTQIWDKETGEDLYPALKEADKKAAELAHWDERALARVMFRIYGLWPYPCTNHIGEYLAWSDGFLAGALPQFYFDPLISAPWRTRMPPEFVYSVDNNPTAQELFPSVKTDREYEAAFDPEKEINPSGEYGISIAEAIFFDTSVEVGAVNLPNAGQAKDLPIGMVIEMPAKVDGKGIHPLQCDLLPAAVAQMISTQGTIHKLVIDAYVEKSRNKLLQAVLLDPTVSSYANAVCMINELCELQKDALPPLYWG